MGLRDDGGARSICWMLSILLVVMLAAATTKLLNNPRRASQRSFVTQLESERR